MKKFLCLFFCMILIQTAYAANYPDLKYKNIKNKEKISYDFSTGKWSKYNKNNGTYFIKTNGFGDFFDYLDSDKNFAFSTNCEYEFIYNDKLIGYSNKDLKFYNIRYENGKVNKAELSKEDVEKMFPDYRVISFNEFSEKTNSLKIKKNFGDLKIILFNDTDKTFEYYGFTSGNSKFEQYDLRGFLTVSKAGMVQFSDLRECDDKSWYVLLIR